MIREEKILVIKDLCGRLPFHVKVAIDFKGYLEMLPDDENLQYPYRKNLKFILDRDNKTIEDISKEPNILYAYPCAERFQILRGYTYELDYGIPIEFIKPYLRPLSSMTNEEQKEFVQFHCVTLCPVVIDEMLTLDNESNMFDWLNSHHFDYRGLIEKGLALEVPEGMYETKTE